MSSTKTEASQNDKKLETSATNSEEVDVLEDDEFEEFEDQHWDEKEEDQEDQQEWEEDWEDEDVDEDFSKQLREELTKHQMIVE